jgi:hypothetical protein
MKDKKHPAALRRVLALLILIGSCLIVLTALYAILFLPLRLNPALVQGMKIIKGDPLIAEMFGAPIHQGLFVMGKLQGFRYGDGTGDLETSINGPFEKGDVTFFMNKPRGGEWQLESMVIYVNGQLAMTWDSDKPDVGFQIYPPSSPASGSATMIPSTSVP